MTNTLHRFGPPETLEGDYIVFAMASRGINDRGVKPKLQEFLRLAATHQPVNLGNSLTGGLHRASPTLTPLVHWRRPEAVDVSEVIRGLEGASATAVFAQRDQVEAFLRDLQQAALGLSVNISALIETAHGCCRNTGLIRHSVEYSLGFHGDLSRLPARHVLELSTMCGHGMVSHALAQKMIDFVKEGRRDPRRAATCLARFCTCGIFNPARAERILEQARVGE